MKTFQLNGSTYETDAATLKVLRSVTPAAKASGDGSAVQAIIFLGMQTGRVRKVA